MKRISAEFLETRIAKILVVNRCKYRLLNSTFPAIVYPGTLAFLLTIFVPIVLDIVAPMDEPRPRQLPIRVECFVDPQKYFYFIYFIIVVSAFSGMTVLMATENMFMIFMQHAGGLFEIVR